VRVELEGALTYHDVVAMIEPLQCTAELASAEVTKGAHDVAPEVDHEGLIHT
jgi:hypothetical protein